MTFRYVKKNGKIFISKEDLEEYFKKGYNSTNDGPFSCLDTNERLVVQTLFSGLYDFMKGLNLDDLIME